MENRLKKQVKHLLLEEDLKITQLLPLLSQKRKKDYDYGSFIQRIGRETVTYTEMLDIAEILGYEIKFVKKNL